MLQVDKQGQHLEHWWIQSQGDQETLNQVHHQAINSAPLLTDWWVTTKQLKAPAAPALLLLLSHTSSLQLPLCSYSSPTALSCSNTAADAPPLAWQSDDANQRVDSLQNSGSLATHWAQQACISPSTCSSCLTAASWPRAPTLRTWSRRRRESRSSAAARTCAPAAWCPTAAQLIRWGIHVISTIVKILTLGTGSGYVCTSWEQGWSMLWRFDCNLQHLWHHTPCKVRHSCHSQC